MSDDIDWAGILASGRLPTATKAQRAAMKRRQAREEKRRKAEESSPALAPAQIDRPTPSAPARVWAADAPPTGTIAGVTFPRAEIRATIRMLEYYRAFLASPDCRRCRNPEHRDGPELTKSQARARLGFLVNVAVSRKAGVPDVACRKQESEYQRALAQDARKINERVGRRIAHRATSLNLPELRARFGHLMSDGD